MLGFFRRRKAERWAKEIAERIAESKRRDQEEKKRHEKSMALLTRAMEAEKAGHYDQALKLYFENLDRYSPHGLLHWERPAILLEKLKRYEEAAKLCVRALALGIPYKSTAEAFQERFSKRKERLLRKLNS